MSDPLAFESAVVIGAGTMGAGIAQICAAAGSEVALVDRTDELVQRGLANVAAFLDKGVARGKTTPEARDATLSRIHATTELDAAAADADLVVEAVPEDLELKRRIFAQVVRSCRGDAVLATNTSSLALSEIFAAVPHHERCLGTHFFNPPPLMPLLEVVATEATSADVVERVLRYAVQLGKDPIVVADSPGFATSRLGVVLGLEAIRMVEAGVAAPADIDKAMELGYRHPMGPLRLTDLVGLDVRMAIADYLRDKLDSPAFEVPALMREMVARGELGKKSGKGFYEWF